ncbi:TPR-like protein [Xylaria scruposa]|nr:TPR-like protein [Xylaria scruposa]
MIPCFVTTPYEENPDFVGRDGILEEIHRALAPTDDSGPKPRTFVLAGLGGMGKTQIAIEYAFRHRDTYKVVLWAHADGRAKLAESYSEFAQELGLTGDEKLNPEVAKQVVKECLATLDIDWLMVIDNADGDDKEELFKEYFPSGDHGSVLITTRDSRLIAQKGGVELTVLDEESAVSLLRTMSRFNADKLDDKERDEELEAALNIVRRIDCLPLAITHAANLILSDSCTFLEFFEAYNNRELIQDCEEVRSVNHSSGATYRYSLRTVWNMNFDRLDLGPQSLIMILSYMDPDRVQLRHLTDGVEKAKEPTLDFMSNAYKRNKLKTQLLRSSLVTQSEKHKELRMHRLVQASCHLRMDLAERRQSFAHAITIIKHCWPIPQRSAIYDPALWDSQQSLLPHVQSLCAHYVSSYKDGNPLIPDDTVNWDFAAILYEAGWYCYERALLGLINDLLLPAEEYCLRHLDKGGGYRILADVYGGIGSLHTESNMFQEAYDSFHKEWHYLKLAFKQGEIERPSIWEVFGLARLGNGLHGLNRYGEAEGYYYQALKAWDGLPGDRTVYTTNLGICLWLQGRLDDAEQRLRPLIKDKEDVTNFRTGYAMLALGNVQISQALALTEKGRKKESETKYKEAMDTHLQSLKLYTLTIGQRHHRTADTYHKVGWHFHHWGNYATALSMLEKALEIYTMNPEHLKNEIARTRYKRGCIYQDMGKRQQGIDEIHEAERLRREIIGPENWKPAVGEEDFDAIVQFWSR